MTPPSNVMVCLVRAREENGRSERLAGILPGKLDFVKVEWDRAAEKSRENRSSGAGEEIFSRKPHTRGHPTPITDSIDS